MFCWVLAFMWLSLDTYAQIHPLNGNTTSKALAQEDNSPWQAAEMVQEWHEESERELIASTWPPDSPDPKVMEASLRSTEPPLWIGLCSDRSIHRIFEGIPLCGWSFVKFTFLRVCLCCLHACFLPAFMEGVWPQNIVYLSHISSYSRWGLKIMPLYNVWFKTDHVSLWISDDWLVNSNSMNTTWSVQISLVWNMMIQSV